MIHHVINVSIYFHKKHLSHNIQYIIQHHIFFNPNQQKRVNSVAQGSSLMFISDHPHLFPPEMAPGGQAPQAGGWGAGR